MRTPSVSVIMPSYNHAPYIQDSIRSVLKQSFPDFELLIEDDGSTDGSHEVIRSVHDPRIHFVANERNQGAGTVTRHLLERARGQYIALINSDDIWLPNKLAVQMQFLENNPDIGAVFSRVQYIDPQNRGLPKSSLPWGHVFDVNNRSRAEWLRHFLFKGNCLCNPTSLIRRKVYNTIGYYDNRLRQLPDFDLWIRLVKHFDIHILSEPLIEFRLMINEQNASGDTPNNAIRVINEYMLIAFSFFDNVSREMLQDGFSDLLKFKYLPSTEHEDIEKVLLLFSDAPWLDHMFKIIGLQKLHALLASPAHRTILSGDYGIDDRSFHDLMGKANAFRPNLAGE